MNQIMNGTKSKEDMEEMEVEDHIPEDGEEDKSCLVKNGTVDYLGRPANKKTTGGWWTAPIICGGEMSERMAAFGIGFNLVTYLVEDLHLPKPYAANLVTNFLGTAFLTCLIGGFVADTWLGRYSTIAVFGCIQFLGLTMMTLFASLPAFIQPRCAPPQIPCHPVHGADLATLYVSLYLIALGTGGIKACVSAFGADQFDYHDTRERKHMASFFNWFFFFISMGAVVAVTLLAYVQDVVGRGWGFGVASSFMLLAVIAFVSGRRVYRYSLPQGSPLTRIGRVIIAAFKKRRQKLPSNPATTLYEELTDDKRDGNCSEPGRPSERIAHTNQFLWLSKAAIIPDADCVKVTTLVLTVTQVEEVKVLIRLLPVLLTTFLFWTVYAQMTTFSVVQAGMMDRKLGRHFEIPASSIMIFLPVSIMIMVVLYDRVLVKIMRQYTGIQQGITTLQRIGVGLVFSLMAMITAAMAEEKRRRTIHRMGPEAYISVFWLLPQYFLVGTGEAFTYVGQLEFFYSESPLSMRSMGSALCLCTMSVGFYSSSFLVGTVDKFSKINGDVEWLADDLNEGHLDRFYWLLAFLCFIDFFLYIVVAKWYKYRPKNVKTSAHTTEEDEHLALGTTV